MIDQRHRASHWIATKSLVVFLLSLFVGIIFVLPIFYNSLASFSFFGFPLGYLLLAVGAPVVMVALIFWFSVRQDKIDRKYGASENI